MEIHAPDRPIHTFRDVLMHLAIVTAGILIALGLETLVEAHHHQQLADEARENIRQELGDNRKEIDFYIKALPEMRKELESAVQSLELVGKNRATHAAIHVGFHSSDLNDASWTTAQSVGALQLLSYAELKKYGAAYSFQRDVANAQRVAVESLAAALAIGDPTKSTNPELLQEENRFRELEAKLWILGQYAQQLEQRYDQVLAEHQPHTR